VVQVIEDMQRALPGFVCRRGIVGFVRACSTQTNYAS
jgi:hypothetical protein